MEWTIRDIIIIAIVGFNLLISIVIKFNDLKHLEKKVNDIKKKVDKIDNKQDEQGERIAWLEGTME